MTDHIELGSDEGAFAIQGAQAAAWAGSTLVQVTDEADLPLMVLTAGQWGPFAVSATAYDAPPPDPGPEWEDVDELSVSAPSGSLWVSELVDGEPGVALDVPAGDLRLRVSGRGRTGEDHGDDDVAHEHYLVEVWPAPLAEPRVVREESAWARTVRAGPEPEPEIEGGEAGLAAATRIGRDVDGAPGARSLSGATGTARASRRIPAARRSLFKYFRVPIPLSLHVPSWSFVSGPDFEEIGAVLHGAAGEAHPDQLSGYPGTIRGVVVEEQSPSRRVSRWAWMVAGSGPNPWFLQNRVPLFDETTLVVTWDHSRDAAGHPFTDLTVEHRDLPVEWLDDMETWWRYQLAFAEHLVLDRS